MMSSLLFKTLKRVLVFVSLLLSIIFAGIQVAYSQTYGTPLFTEDFGTVPSGQDVNAYRGDITGRGTIGSSYWFWPATCTGTGYINVVEQYSGLIASIPANGTAGYSDWAFVVADPSTAGNNPYSNVQYSELFNGATTTFTVSGTGATATKSTYFSEGTGSYLFKESNRNQTGYYTMTNSIDLTGDASPQLTFSQICATEAGKDYGFVEYSTDNGTNWTTFPSSSYAGTGTLKNSVVSFDKSSYTNWNTQFTAINSTPGTAPATSLWKTETINIPIAAISSTFKIRFRTTTDNTTNTIYYGWLIDNVQISDIGSTNINNPNNTWCYSGTTWTKNPSSCSGTLSRWYLNSGTWQQGHWERTHSKVSVPCAQWHAGMDDG